jgi:(p)ppGpp synthase/HD superfamily hydrolase
MKNSNAVKRAVIYAKRAHEGQFRKYTGEPYISHPVAVMNIVKTVPHTEEMLMAAALHDTIEDTTVTYTMLFEEFGKEVAELVNYCSDISQPSDGNRAVRKTIDAKWYASGPAGSQTIKVADLIHNTESIARHDPSFYKTYKHEKVRLLNLLTLADKALLKRAWKQIKNDV